MHVARAEHTVACSHGRGNQPGCQKSIAVQCFFPKFLRSPGTLFTRPYLPVGKTTGLCGCPQVIRMAPGTPGRVTRPGFPAGFARPCESCLRVDGNTYKTLLHWSLYLRPILLLHLNAALFVYWRLLSSVVLISLCSSTWCTSLNDLLLEIVFFSQFKLHANDLMNNEE